MVGRQGIELALVQENGSASFQTYRENSKAKDSTVPLNGLVVPLGELMQLARLAQE